MRKGRKIVSVLLQVGRVSVGIHYCSEIFFPARTRAARAKKKISDKAICSRHQRALSGF